MFDDSWTTRQWRKHLVEKYPYLLPRRASDGQVSPTYDYNYFHGEYDLPDGWLQLFLQCCEDIYEPLKKVDYLHKFRFTQIKEKWGRMELYTHGATKEVQDIIDKYRFLSQQVCSVCGKPATVMTYGYVCPYCSEHVKDSMTNVDEAELIEIKTSFIQEQWFPKDGNIKRHIDCTDEWNKYLERIGYEDEV